MARSDVAVAVGGGLLGTLGVWVMGMLGRRGYLFVKKRLLQFQFYAFSNHSAAVGLL